MSHEDTELEECPRKRTHSRAVRELVILPHPAPEPHTCPARNTSKPESECTVREKGSPGTMGKASVMSNLGKPLQSLDFILKFTRKPLAGVK